MGPGVDMSDAGETTLGMQREGNAMFVNGGTIHSWERESSPPLGCDGKSSPAACWQYLDRGPPL